MPNVAELGIKVNTNELRLASTQLNRFGSEAKKTDTAVGKLNKSIKGTAMAFAGALGLTAAVAGIVSGLKDAIKTFAAFDQAMKNVGSVAGASAMQMKQLSDAARQMAKTSVFTAREVANAQYYLASAGLKVNQIIDAQRGVMDLAAATQSDLASTSEAVASALSQFSLKAADATKVANVYAAAISMSQATQQKLTDAMRYAGPVAGQLGQSIEKTTAQIMAMFNAGLRGEQAGTSLRAAMLRLQDPTKKVKETFAALNISLYDSAGAIRPFEDVLNDLAKANITAGEAAAIFGQEAVSGILAVLKNLDKVKEYEAAITGTSKANEMAAQQMSGMENELKQLEAAWEELQMTLVGRYAPQIINAIQSITEAINDMSGALNASDTEMEIFNKLLREASGTNKWWQDIPGIRQFYDVLGAIVVTMQGFDPLEAAKAIKQADEESKEWAASFEDLRKALDKVEVKVKSTGDVGKRAAGENKKATKDLINTINKLQEAIKAGSETTLQTQLRHLDELVKKYKNNAKIIALVEQRKNQLIIKSAKDTADEISDLYDKEVEAAQKLGEEAVKARDASGKEIVKINKSSLQQMLEDWADYSKGWEDIAKNFLEGIQSSFASTFKNVFEGAEDAWDGLWESFKNIAYQALAAIATKLASGLVASIVVNIVPSLSGILGGSSTGGLSNLFGGFSDLFGTNIGDASFFPGGIANGIDWSSILGAAGLGMLGGGLLNNLTGGNSTFGSLGGGLGAGLGMFLGGPLGGVLGGLGGSLLGGLFGGGDDTAEREADAKAFRDLAQKISEGIGTQEDYINAIKYAHSSDNRVGGAAMEQLYALAKEQGILDWWAPTPGQMGEESRRNYTDEQWKRFQVYGGAESGQLGALGMGEWFGGNGEGGWGGQFDQVKEALEGLSDDIIDTLGTSITDIQDGLGTFGITLQDLMQDITLEQVASGEWSDILKDRLQPASLLARMEDKMRAEGLDELTIATQKQAAIIDTLTGSFNMNEEDTNSWIDQLLNANGDVTDLTAKMNEYNDIIEQLKGLRAGEEEKAKELIERARKLREELGLGPSAFDKVKTAMENLGKTMTDEVLPKLEDFIKRLIAAMNGENNNTPTAHTGGRMHVGGIADMALRNGLITPHGGRFHTGYGSLLNNEVSAILQRGEFVTRANSVNMHTLPILQEMNRTGEAPSGGITFAPTINVPSTPENKEHARRMGKEIADTVWTEFDKRIRRGESLGGIN